MQRFTNWMVTSFDLDEFHVPDQHPEFKYMVYQIEECPLSGKWHVQGYLELKRQCNLNIVRAMFAPAIVHLDRRMGTQAQARAYCMKLDSRVSDPMEWGDYQEVQPGKRLDLTNAAKLIRAARSWNDVINNDELFVVVSKHLTWAREIFNAREQVIPDPGITLRMWQKDVLEVLELEPVKRQVIWIWSALSKTGKTTFFDYCSHKYSVLPATDWVNTLYIYDGQRIIWFDRTRQESRGERNVDQFYVDLEKWSNHTFHTSTKYQPVRKLVRAHVVVTANCGPDHSRLPERFRVVVAKTDLEEQIEADGLSHLVRSLSFSQ